jgi:hypothetical protein
MDRVKVVTVVFMAIVTVLVWIGHPGSGRQGGLSYAALAIWGEPCQIEIHNAMIDHGQLVTFVRPPEGGKVHRYFMVNYDFARQVKNDKNDHEKLHPDDPYTIDGRCVPWYPKIAAVKDDDRGRKDAISRSIIGTVAVVCFGSLFLVMHSRRTKARAAAGEGPQESNS